jgi:hypothetical protein
MRAFLIAADVVMGLILGLFLYVAVTRLWDGLHGPLVGAVIFAASVVIVLFRRPGGSLTKPQRDRER